MKSLKPRAPQKGILQKFIQSSFVKGLLGLLGGLTLVAAAIGFAVLTHEAGRWLAEMLGVSHMISVDDWLLSWKDEIALGALVLLLFGFIGFALLSVLGFFLCGLVIYPLYVVLLLCLFPLPDTTFVGRVKNFSGDWSLEYKRTTSTFGCVVERHPWVTLAVVLSGPSVPPFLAEMLGYSAMMYGTYLYIAPSFFLTGMAVSDCLKVLSRRPFGLWLSRQVAMG